MYDKVYRADILSHAHDLVRSHRGAPGIDGVTFEAIEALQRKLYRKAKQEPGFRFYVLIVSGVDSAIAIP